MNVLETDRLILRRLTLNDADFILGLMNEPSFIRHIGDKGVHTLDDARQYILNGPVASYEQNGFGLYLVELKEAQTPIGTCGLLKRDTLPHPDIGFAFLPAYWNKGYAFESAAAVMNYARETLGLDRIVAIASPDNEASAKLLGKIGLRFERMIKLSADADEIKLFACNGNPAKSKMNLDALKDLYRHMEWADASVWQAVLASEDACGDKKIRELFYHLHMVQRAFLRVWRGEPRETPYPTFEDAQSLMLWGQSYYHEAFAQFNQLSDGEVSAPMPVPWAAMVEQRLGRAPDSTTISETALQVALHSLYHRGQINARLREAGGEPPLVDYIAWVWLGRPGADWSRTHSHEEE